MTPTASTCGPSDGASTCRCNPRVRGLFQTVFHLYFRSVGCGSQHLPSSGPLILASNHRSFLDPFVIGTLVRRPVYYVAKEELFNRPLAGVGPQQPRRVPVRPRRERPGGHGHGAPDPRAR